MVLQGWQTLLPGLLYLFGFVPLWFYKVGKHYDIEVDKELRFVPLWFYKVGKHYDIEVDKELRFVPLWLYKVGKQNALL